MRNSKVVVLKTNPQTVVEDYAKLMHLAEYQNILPKNTDIVIKLNLSWTKFYPACSSPPWQLEGVLNTLISDGYNKHMLYPLGNRTVAANPKLGAYNNKWTRVLKKYDINFTSLVDTEWVKYEYDTSELLVLPKLFPQGILIPKMFIGRSIIHLPVMKTHGYSVTAGAVKNAFGGLVKKFPQYTHKYVHEILVDLLMVQKKIHPVVFAVMDAAVCGDGAGPRAMIPRTGNYILASSDSVALDAVAAKIMGFDPMKIDYMRIADERGLGCARLQDIEIVGHDIKDVNFCFKVKSSPVSPRRAFNYFLMHSKLVNVFSAASGLYDDGLWYPTIGRKRIRDFYKTDWGKLFLSY